MKLGQHIVNYAFKEGTSIFKDGTTLSDVEKALSGFDESLKGLSVDETKQLFEDTTFLKSYTDSKKEEGIRTREINLTKKHADDLKEFEEKLRSELSPKETPEQKKLRELEAQIKDRDRKEALRDLQDSLSEKAKELKFDPMRARDFAVFGADAEKKLSEYAEFFNTAIEEKVNSQVKERFSTSTPKIKVGEGGLSTLSNSELNALAVSDPSKKPAIMEEIKKRMIPT